MRFAPNNLRGKGRTSQLSTNAQRFERICRTLDQPGAPADLIAATEDDVADIKEYRYQSEAALTYKLIIGAARSMVRQYLLTRATESESLTVAMNDLCTRKDEFDELDALRRISDELKPHPGPEHGQSRRILYSLIDAVWQYTFMYYFQLQRERKQDADEAATGK